MKAKIERARQPEPLPVIPPMGQLIQFPRKAAKQEHKVPSMKCCKTDMMDWNFNRW